MNSQKKAFTLLELSVVLLVIGVLVVGIVQGGGLVKASRIANARSFTAKSVVPEISGLIAWYETSTKDALKESESYNNAQTSEWYDISPSSIVTKKNKLARTANSNVIYQSDGINKIPSIQFKNTANITLSSFYQGPSSQATVFIVFRPSNSPSSTEKILLDSSSSGSSAQIGIKSNAVFFNLGTSASTGTSSNAASFIVGKDYILAAYLNSSYSKAFVNNAKTEAGSASVNPGTNQLSGLTIGTNKSNSKPFNGFISEIIIYNRPLQLQERKDVMSYLSKKYQIAVSGI